MNVTPVSKRLAYGELGLVWLSIASSCTDELDFLALARRTARLLARRGSRGLRIAALDLPRHLPCEKSGHLRGANP